MKLIVCKVFLDKKSGRVLLFGYVCGGLYGFIEESPNFFFVTKVHVITLIKAIMNIL